ncbi:GNAT family N-acetyltransferase [Pseudonocardia halophobica]|uniref:N-acetyltransferase n=1 Tax=Pseudonocardia halophobica TaxID=29401 RepID=A0A9W6LAD8_9PSEU|nr:GNAT family N-acetyltransferase [Pseudonocardia halophobica]GLL14600.1 N-acetyltransferase [Pseudonocardia halophobica]
MEPVEINAGTWYLRALRADDRVTDVPALTEAGVPDALAHVRLRAARWSSDTGCSWAVAEPTTGEMLGEIALTGLGTDTPEITCWALGRARGRGMTSTALGAVLRFAAGGLGLERIRCGGSGPAAARLAARSGAPDLLIMD